MQNEILYPSYPWFSLYQWFSTRANFTSVWRQIGLSQLGEGVLAYPWKGPVVLLNTPECTEQPLKTKNDVAQMSAEPQLRSLAIDEAQHALSPNSIAEKPRRKFSDKNKKRIFIFHILSYIKPSTNFPSFVILYNKFLN